MLSQKRIVKGLKWFVLTLCTLFIVGAFVRIPHVLEVKKTAEQVAKIHATKLTLADVIGENLPPDPGAEADKTIAGIDANKNGIRDDVELAIFKEYPDSARVRLPLLQRALVMQMQMTLPLLNEETATATVEDGESRSDVCLWTLSNRSDLKKFLSDMKYYEGFVNSLQLNTPDRSIYMHNFYNYLRSYGSSNDGCDISPSNL